MLNSRHINIFPKSHYKKYIYVYLKTLSTRKRQTMFCCINKWSFQWLLNSQQKSKFSGKRYVVVS